MTRFRNPFRIELWKGHRRFATSRNVPSIKAMKEKDASDWLESEACELFRLLAKTARLSRGRNQQRQYLTAELARLVGADGWSWKLFDRRKSNRGGRVIHTFGGGSLALSDTSDHTNDARINLTFQTQGGLTSEYCFERTAKHHQPHSFTENEIRILTVVFSEVPWLHQLQHDPERGIPLLSPRTQTTLKLMLEGKSRKMIADEMQLSMNTVARYAQNIYRHFGVRRHSDLIICLDSFSNSVVHSDEM